MSLKWFESADRQDKSPILNGLDAIEEALLLITETHPGYETLLALLAATLEEIKKQIEQL